MLKTGDGMIEVMGHSDTFVIVPVFNEATVVGGVLASLKKHFNNIICVDDGSQDDSANIIEGTNCTLIRHPMNLGVGAATQTGIDFVLQFPNAKYFITFDADGQHNVEDALSMLEFLKAKGLNIVFGSRFSSQETNIYLRRKGLLYLAAAFSKRISGLNLSDPHNGLRVFDRKFAQNLKLSLPDFAHASELVERVAEKHFSYGEFPVTVTYSEYSRSKAQPLLNSINIAIDLVFYRMSRK